ncbi:MULTISPECIES: hypothetical protein [unclassified Nocardioides]|uniref:hypothetical protein n=1 Tax=unclassified Nocardioides TaxID=2615069 RepID=UPI0011502DAB|nr:MULTISPECIES: hypothetical protein [unclassified Nocardioides]TQK70060.1 hypothetical protein FBY23_1829 [Nocardioides sp. SLBN-35]WGY00706.1 hypothetical protein QI633_19455 [Nocardioides sp. QY071]
MKLHQSLAELARDHGTALFRDATAFRGSLDDYLDEGQASSGTINLLTDAVRLGALDGLVTMLESGARPGDAVESAGQRLARDRGSADVRGCQWAIAVLGFALGKVPESLVTGLDPEAGTAAPPSHGPGGTAPSQPPVTSPVQQPFAAPAQQQPIMSPPHQPVQPSYGAPGATSWSQPTPPKKSGTGFIVGAIAVALVVVVAGIIGIIAVANSGSDKKADDTKSKSTEATSASADPTDDTTDEPSGNVATGTGYETELPSGWIDGTDDFTSQNPGLSTLDRVFIWGSTFNTARGNVIVETQSSYGSTDPSDLADDWKTALVADDDTATTNDIDDTTIGGETALGVDISRTNDNGIDVSQRSYLVISGDTAYSITVSLKDGDDDVLTKFDDILSAWTWTD